MHVTLDFTSVKFVCWISLPDVEAAKLKAASAVERFPSKQPTECVRDFDKWLSKENKTGLQLVSKPVEQDVGSLRILKGGLLSYKCHSPAIFSNKVYEIELIMKLTCWAIYHD